YLFDYDDTLVGRDQTLTKSSKYNIRGLSRLNELTNVGVCTGNSVKAIAIRGEPAALTELSEPIYKPLIVFADGGVNLYSCDTGPVESGGSHQNGQGKCINPDVRLSRDGKHSANELVGVLCRAGIPLVNIDVRGSVVVAIKPVPPNYRKPLLC